MFSRASMAKIVQLKRSKVKERQERKRKGTSESEFESGLIVV